MKLVQKRSGGYLVSGGARLNAFSIKNAGNGWRFADYRCFAVARPFLIASAICGVAATIFFVRVTFLLFV